MILKGRNRGHMQSPSIFMSNKQVKCFIENIFPVLTRIFLFFMNLFLHGCWGYVLHSWNPSPSFLQK
jgi:hypothetical protein